MNSLRQVPWAQWSLPSITLTHDRVLRIRLVTFPYLKDDEFTPHHCRDRQPLDKSSPMFLLFHWPSSAFDPSSKLHSTYPPAFTINCHGCHKYQMNIAKFVFKDLLTQVCVTNSLQSQIVCSSPISTQTSAILATAKYARSTACCPLCAKPDHDDSNCPSEPCSCVNCNKRRWHLLLRLSHLSILNQKLLDSILNMARLKEAQAAAHCFGFTTPSV